MFYLLIIICLTLGLLALDSFGNPELVKKLIGISSYNLMAPSAILLFFLRKRSGTLPLPKILKKTLLWGTVLLTLITIATTLFGAFTHENALFSLTRLHQSRLMLLSLYATISLLMIQTDSWWKKHYQQFILFLPFVVFGYLAFARLFPFNIFLEIVKEDELIEYLQFFVLAGGAVANGLLAAKLFPHQNTKIMALLHGFIALGFLVVAGDEISWGQRLLDIKTTATFAAHNRQGEISLHNLYTFEWLVIYAYIIISWVGLLGRRLVKMLGSLAKYQNYFAITQTVGYFLLPTYFFTLQLISPGAVREWSEPAELFLYTGMVLWSVFLPNTRRSPKP